MDMDPSEMAELFADRAYGRINTMTKPTDIQSQPPPDQSPQEIRPLGWGPIAERIVAESVPVFDNTERFVPPVRSPTEIEGDLLSKIRRGREAGLLAVGYDEIGDVVTAKELYMDALCLLVPACRDLDNGPGTNRRARIREQAKVRREASAMLGRCVLFITPVEAEPLQVETLPQLVHLSKSNHYIYAVFSYTEPTKHVR